VDYRDRQRRETLAKLSKPARALHEDLTRWLAAEDEEKPQDPRPAQLRARLALLPAHPQRYVLRLWRQQRQEIRTLEAQPGPAPVRGARVAHRRAPDRVLRGHLCARGLA
jgi:hypothetical protein